MKSDEDLRQLAIGVIAGTVTLSCHVPADLWTNVFLPLGLLTEEQSNAMIARAPALIYGELHHAIGLRSVNGFPIFSKFSELSEDERDRLQLFINELKPRPVAP